MSKTIKASRYIAEYIAMQLPKEAASKTKCICTGFSASSTYRCTTQNTLSFSSRCKRLALSVRFRISSTAVLFLAGAAFVTGVLLAVDGGMSTGT
jgi:hypothetical protein